MAVGLLLIGLPWYGALTGCDRDPAEPAASDDAAATAAPAGSVTRAGSTGPADSTAPVDLSSEVPDGVSDAVRAAIDAVNAAADGTPAQQQQQLADRVDPDRRAEVESCPAATTTVRFEPVYAGLRPTSTADTYALPTLIRVQSGGRVTGTDLTTLQLLVRQDSDGTDEAYLTPFCVN